MKLNDLVANRPYTPGVLEWKARISIRSLDSIDDTSTTAPSPQPPKPQEAPSKLTLAPRLCYACHTHLTSRTPRPRESAEGLNVSAVALPMWTSASLADTAVSERENKEDVNESVEGDAEVWRTQKMDRGEMRETVGSFLLDDADADAE